MKKEERIRLSKIVSINIDRIPYHDKLREAAFKQNRTIKEILEELIAKHL